MNIESSPLKMLAILLGVAAFAFSLEIVLRFWRNRSGSSANDDNPDELQPGRRTDKRRLVIRNRSQAELGIMLEPWTDREDVEPGGQIIFEADFSEEEIMIDFGEDSFLSIWCPPGSELRKSP